MEKDVNKDKVLDALGWLGEFVTAPEYINCEIYNDKKRNIYINNKKYDRKLTKEELKEIKQKLAEIVKAENVKPIKSANGKITITTLYTKNFSRIEYLTVIKTGKIFLDIRRTESQLEKINKNLGIEIE